MKFISPNWPAPKNVKAFSSTRWEGVSQGVYQGLNLGMHVGDDEVLVQTNRNLVVAGAAMPTSPVWLNQTHSNSVIELNKLTHQALDGDGAITTHKKIVCTVMTADCLPVLLTNTDGTQVAAVHAGWRGLADGILENAVQQFTKPSQVMAWIGPAIGSNAFEVGSDVFEVFTHFDSHARDAFIRHHPKRAAKDSPKKWLANMSLLATQRLNLAGVEQVFDSQRCTFSEPDDFYSYRRDGVTGRQATFIWME
ncbi:peptidoglycan editing factor PgeF [Vibrio rumoiensis]|uniref:Purine nucleoside phosphorylase n=1 Tax=Vibrio rumoiensis 1S-45 TaxID=1188252 RepID=A0A1E5DYH0_9VIBR|nr:peptidoglycan editing factor PgeF [Vibrio rumoiensis]OEF22560.1 multi-copper polyphenol oxidoreductase [Vibrio rumoiensis 1S-45]